MGGAGCCDNLAFGEPCADCAFDSAGAHDRTEADREEGDDCPMCSGRVGQRSAAARALSFAMQMSPPAGAAGDFWRRHTVAHLVRNAPVGSASEASELAIIGSYVASGEFEDELAGHTAETALDRGREWAPAPDEEGDTSPDGERPTAEPTTTWGIPAPPTWVTYHYVCCCPRNLTGDGEGGRDYRWRNPFPPGEVGAIPHPCEGHAFEAVFEYEWLPHSTFKPCELEWIEESNKSKRLSNGRMLPPNEPYSINKYEPRSATFQEWNVRMEHRSAGSAAARAGETEQIRMKDIPCLDPLPRLQDGRQDPRRRSNTRVIEGRIVIKPGCPQCKTRTLHWAQRVRWDNGQLETNWFAIERTRAGGEDPADASVPNDEAYAQWVAAHRRAWRG